MQSPNTDAAGTHTPRTDVSIISARKPLTALLVVVLVVSALVVGYKSLWLLLGNEVARNAFDRDGAASALRWSPGDPKAHHTRAVLDERFAEGFDVRENARAVLESYEAATRLSPNDFRYWIDLGRARERAGDADGGIAALRRAAELAPFYALPRWHLGNALMREGRAEEAFEELRRAGEADETYRKQAVNLAWRYFRGDVPIVRRALGDSPAVQADLLTYLMNLKRFDEAIEVWNGMRADGDAATIKDETRATLARALFDNKRFRDAARLSNANAEQIVNRDFETDVLPNRDLFGWHLAAVAGLRVELDTSIRQGGARALRLTMSAPNGVDLSKLQQTIAVEPGARYRFGVSTRGDGLRSASLPLVEAVDARSGAVLAASSPVGAEANGWERKILEFTMPPGSDGLTLRVNRQACPDTVCPVFGRVWLDELALERMNGKRGG